LPLTSNAMKANAIAKLNGRTADSIRNQIMKGVARGEQAIREGRTYTHAEVRKRWALWLKKLPDAE
jgi:hypothetical protein